MNMQPDDSPPAPANPRDMRLRLPANSLLTPGRLMLQIDPGTYQGRKYWFVQEATILGGTIVMVPEGRDIRESVTLLEGVIAALLDRENNPIPASVNMGQLVTSGVARK